MINSSNLNERIKWRWYCASVNVMNHFNFNFNFVFFECILLLSKTSNILKIGKNILAILLFYQHLMKRPEKESDRWKAYFLEFMLRTSAFQMNHSILKLKSKRSFWLLLSLSFIGWNRRGQLVMWIQTISRKTIK